MHRSLLAARRSQVAAAVVAVFGSTTLQAANVEWDGGGGAGNSFWDVITNWSTNLLPGAADDVLLGTFDTTFRSGTVTIQSFNGTGTLSVTGGSLSATAASSTDGLNFSAGTIRGIGNINITGVFAWTGGTMTDAGSTSANTVNISGAATKTLSGGRILNAVDTTWSGGAITVASGSVFNSTGSFADVTTSASSISSGGTFNNSGTFSKQSNTTTTVSAVFNNTGTVDVNAGTMLMQTGTSTGTFNIAEGAKLEFRNGSHTLDNATTSGAGTLQISTDGVGADGSVVINAGTHNSALLMSGGFLSGTSHVFQGPATWTGGTISGDTTQSTTFGGTLTISGVNTKTLSGGRSMNAGNTSWTGNTGNGNNAIGIASTSVFNNTGSFTDSNTFDSSISGGTFNNSGTFDKQSNTTSSIGTVFNNTGTANVNAGTMLMNGGGTSTGVFNIANGAKLEYRNGTHALNNVTMNGAGTFQISSEGVGADAFVAVNGGTLNTAFLLSGSTLRGTDHVFQGPATWTGGTINAQVAGQSTTFANTLVISGASGKTLSGGRILSAGNTTWTGNTGNNNNAVSLGGSSTFNNTGSFTDANTFDSSITAGTFNNSGTFNKQSNTTSSIGTVFNNTGTVNVNAGTMLMNGGGASTGVFNIANSAKLEYRNGTHTLDNVTMNGAGTFQVSSEGVGADAFVAVNGGSLNTAFVLSGSTLAGSTHAFQGVANWTGGTITGTFAQSTIFGNALTISGPDGKTLSGGRSVIAGNTTWSGNTANNDNAIGISGGSAFISNGIFTDANTFNSTINRGNGGGAFTNNGTFDKQSNTTTSIGTAFNNSGTVNVNAGTMLMTSLDASASTGAFNIAGGAKLEYRNGPHTLDNVTTSGAGIVEISTEPGGAVGADATVTVNGGTHTTAFVLSGSTMAGSSATFQGPATWTGGTISGAATTTFDNDVTISGANTKAIVGGRTVVLNGTTTWSGNTGNQNNAIRFWNGATINNNGTFNDANQFASFIEHNVGGPHNFNNNGIYNKQSNTLTTVDLGVGFNNSGTLNINAGTMLFSSGTQGPTGTVRVASGATFQIGAASTAGNMITAGTLALADRTLTVHIDYDNANFGVGNAFNRRANVTTSGAATPRLLAAGDANQGLSGVGISNGNTATPTIVLGNVHVGATTYTYNINNTGTTGPALRGAIQTTVNGGNITDARLSGNGVQAGNFGPIATGQSVSRDVTITVGTAGVYAPFTGQAVNILNNFENTRSQLLTITSAAGAAAYNLAAGNVTPTPVVLANQRVGGSGTQALTVSNTAPAGAFTEVLNASFGANTGSATNNGGSVSVAGGNSAAGFMSAGVSTSSAGAKSGTVVVNFVSDGNGSSGLGLTNVGSQTINVSGNVYQVAQPTALPASVNLGNFRAGTAQSQTVTLTNTNISPAGFQEGLNASIVGTSGAGTGSGALNNVAAGASGNLQIGVTGVAGANTGSVQVQLATNGTGTSGLGNLNLGGAQTVTVTGTGWRLAAANTQPTTINFGNVLVGSTQAQALNIQNTAIADGFSERLDASFLAGGTTGAATNNGGSIGLLAAGASNNTAMSVGVNTATIGAKTGQVIVAFNSNGLATSGLGITALPNQNIGILADVTANVGTLAQPSAVTPNPVNFGNFRIGAAGAGPQSLTISNLATIGEGLNASIATASAGFGATGAFTNLAPQATNNSSLQVSFNGTGTAGAMTGTATVTLVSDGTFNGGTTTPLPSQTVTMNAGVYNAAVGSTTPTPVVIANQRVFGTGSQLLTVENTAAPGAFSEALNASFSGATGAATNNAGSVSNLIAGGANATAMSVGVNTSTAGAKTGTVTLAYQTDGTGPNGNSGLAAIAAGSQVINVSGNVYSAAAGNASTPVQVANQRVGGSNTAIVTVANAAAAGSFSEDLNASIGGLSGAASGSGSIAGRLAGASTGGGAIMVGVDSSAAGAKTGTVTLNYQSAGAVNGVSNGLGTLAVGSQVVTVNGNVYQAATGALQTGPLNFGTVQVGQSVSQSLVVGNVATGAAGFVEDLNASFGSASGTGAGLISGSGSLSGILAGTNSSAANGAMTVNVNTAAAGVVNGNIAVNYFTAGAVNGVSNGLGTAAANSELYGVAGTIQAVANVINQASPSINNATINLGNVRVNATSPTQAVSVTNVATVAPQAALNATVSATAPITASGSFNLLAPGGTDNSSIVVGMQTATAGAKTGTATISFVSDASNVGNCAPNCQFNLASQNVTVNGAVYNAAVGSATPTPVVIANQRVNGTGSQVLSVANTAASGAFSEALNASFSGATGTATTNSGSVSNLIAGGINATSMSVGVNTASAGAKTGTVTLAYQTDGTGSNGNSGLAAISAGTQLIGVSGNVYQAASGALQTAPLNFGTLQVGQVINQNLVVRNTAGGAAGFVEDLNATFGSSGNSQITGAGSLSGITAGNNSTAGNGTMTVTVTGSTAGALNSGIAVNYFSAGAVGGVGNGLGTLAVGSENYAVNGTISAVGNVVNQASPLVNTPSINLGAVRVGAAAPSATVSVSNVATVAPQAALNASIASDGAPVTASGSFNLLNPGATNSTSLQVGLNTATAGNFTGANAGKATISFVSDASNVGGCEPNCQLNLASQSVSVQGKVYTQAVGQLATGAVDFGIVRVGDKVGTRDVTVQNTAAVTALNDTLRADLSGISGPFSSGNSVAGVGAQASGNITVGLDTLKAGIFNQTGSMAFLSQNPDMADISAGPDGSVQVKAQVNNLANADFDLLAGIGVLQQFGNAYVLDLGNIVIGSLINELLQLENEVAGPADALRGMFNVTAANDFKFSGWNEFKDLQAGSAIGGLSVAFNALSLGLFEDTIAFDGFSYNTSDPDGLAQSRSLLIRANVVDGTSTVPEPGSAALAVLAMLSLWLARRRQQQAATRQ